MIYARTAALRGLALGACGLVALTDAVADGNGFGGGITVGSWNPSYTGSVTIDEHFDFRDDLALRGHSRPYFGAELRFPQRWLPELSIAHTTLRAEGDRPVTPSLVGGADLGPIDAILDGIIGGLVPGTAGRRQTDIDVDDSFLTARWRLLSVGGFDLLPGATLRRLDGRVLLIEDGLLLTSESDSEVDEVLPMLHLGMRWSGNALVAELYGNWIESGDEEVYDAAARMWWSPAWAGPLRAGFGWQLRRYAVRGTDTEVRARLSGVSVALGAYW